MGMTFTRNTARFEDTVGVDDAEKLLDWLRKHPKGKVNLASCTHLHTALLQVVMASRVPVAAWPDDESLKSWLISATSILGV